MALTFTVAGLQTQLDTFNTAVQAESWGAAWKAYLAYAATYGGLIKQATADGASVTLPEPETLRAGLAQAQAAAASVNDNRRWGKLGVRHGS